MLHTFIIAFAVAFGALSYAALIAWLAVEAEFLGHTVIALALCAIAFALIVTFA